MADLDHGLGADAPATAVNATLGRLLEHLEILPVLAASVPLDMPVSAPLVHDPLDPARLGPGDVVLAVGVDPEHRDAAELVRRAGAAGAAAVVVKLRDDVAPTALCEVADAAGVALLGTGPDVAWGQLYALLSTAIASLGVAGAPAPGGVAVGDLFKLANAVAAMVGGPTTIENPQSTVLAYSSLDEPIDEPRRQTILGRRVPAGWLRRLSEDGVFQRLWGTDEVVRIDYDEPSDFRPRLAVAVRAGGQILGSIWVAEGNKPLGPEAAAALREAARIAALHLVRHTVGEDLDRRRNAELFRLVLEGRRPAELLGGEFHLPPYARGTVLAVELNTPGLADVAMQVDRLTSLIGLYAAAYRHHVVCAAIGRVVYLLLADAGPTDPAAIRRLATAVVRRSAESLGVTVRVGIGDTVALSDALRSRQAADLVLRALTEAGGPRSVANAADVHPHLVLVLLRDLAATEPALRSGKLDVLAEMDAKRHTVYLPTLRAFLDALGDVPTAAALCGVHPNTYRYRLRRLVGHAHLDLDDPVERLVLHLQLYLLAGADGRPAQTHGTQLCHSDDD